MTYRAEREDAESPALRWFAIQIRQASRKNCEQMLAYHGAEVFSPSATVRRQWSDRIKMIDVPLFPGYLFGRFDPARRQPILMTPGVVGIVNAGKKLLEVNPSELDAVRAALKSEREVNPVPYLATGRCVKIASGPLRGLEGVVEQVKSRSRLLLSVTMLNRSVAVELDEADIVDAPSGC